MVMSTKYSHITTFKANNTRKIGFTVGHVIILVNIFSVLACNIERTAEVIWLVPNEYTGPVVVYYDQLKGDSIEYENGQRVYRIDANGMLMSQFPSGVHVSKETVYHVTSNGTRIIIPYLSDIEGVQTTADSMAVFYFLNGDLGPVEQLNSDGNIDCKKPERRMLTIGNIADFHNRFDLYFDYIRSLPCE